jgi:hypothetical protein
MRFAFFVGIQVVDAHGRLLEYGNDGDGRTADHIIGQSPERAGIDYARRYFGGTMRFIESARGR